MPLSVYGTVRSFNLNSRVYFVTTFHHPAAMESYHTESIYSFAA